MRTITIKTIAIFLVTSFITMSCKKGVDSPQGGTSDGGGGAKPNTVSGNIYDAKGNKFKIPGSEVTVHVWGPGGIGNGDQAYNISMDQNSHYESKVDNGVYAFHVRAYMPLNGQKVCIDLAPTDGKEGDITFESAPGVNRDFQLVLSGLGKGGDPNDANSYYGGHIWVMDGARTFTDYGYWNNLKAKYPGAKITFVLTPGGPCLDGSDAPAKKIDISVDDVNAGKYLVNFPLALYRVSAVLTTADGQEKALKLTTVQNALGAHYDYIDETFPPNPDDVEGHPLVPEIAVWED